MNNILSNKYFWIILTFALSLVTTFSAIGLIIGILIALIFGNPITNYTSKLSKYLLQISVVLLGFGMDIKHLIQVGIASIGITLITIIFTFIIGIILGKIFKLEKDLSILITSGTAICGGSAIAAMAPAINAKESHTAIALSVVFLLNAIALFIFPPIGHFFNLSEEQFGLWSAIAIHDTSSVVGAAATYGSIAAGIAITVKLTRALWIIPLSITVSKFYKSETKPKFQWFLLFFIMASIISTYIPLNELWQMLLISGKHLMTGTLFLVGSVLTISQIKKLGLKSLSMALILWLVISILSFLIIYFNFLDFIY